MRHYDINELLTYPNLFSTTSTTMPTNSQRREYNRKIPITVLTIILCLSFMCRRKASIVCLPVYIAFGHTARNSFLSIANYIYIYI